jgi:hypothetical protein
LALAAIHTIRRELTRANQRPPVYLAADDGASHF